MQRSDEIVKLQEFLTLLKKRESLVEETPKKLKEYPLKPNIVCIYRLIRLLIMVILFIIGSALGNIAIVSVFSIWLAVWIVIFVLSSDKEELRLSGLKLGWKSLLIAPVYKKLYSKVKAYNNTCIIECKEELQKIDDQLYCISNLDRSFAVILGGYVALEEKNKYYLKISNIEHILDYMKKDENTNLQTALENEMMLIYNQQKHFEHIQNETYRAVLEKMGYGEYLE